MPKSKLETLKDERARLSRKGKLSERDQRRLDQLGSLINREERSSALAVYKRPVSGPLRNPVNPVSPWQSRGATRVVDAKSTFGSSAGDKAMMDDIRGQFGFSPLTAAGMAVGVRDPETGQVSYQVDPSIAGYNFGPAMQGGQRGGAVGRSSRNINMLNGMSAKAIQEFYYSLDDAELIKFQSELVEAGLVEKPILGFRDESTSAGLGMLMRIWADAGNVPIQDVLKKLKQANATRLDEEVKKMTGKAGVGVVSDEVANVAITDATTLDSLVDRVSQDLFGQFLDPERKAALVAQLQEEERSNKTSRIQADFAADVKSQQDKLAAESGGGELEQFMEALIGKESGGSATVRNPDSGAIGLGQIMPENWGPWAAEAGADPSDFSAENQRRIIRYKLAQYYQTYGSWRDVALVWYGGAGGRARALAGGGDRPEGGWSSGNVYDSLNAYADSVIAKMNQLTGAKLESGRTPQLTVNTVEELADPRTRAEDALKRLDPAAYAGTQFAKQAEGFFSLLGGVN